MCIHIIYPEHHLHLFLLCIFIEIACIKEVRKALKNEKEKRFLEMNWNIFPDLVKVFYQNLVIDGENMSSNVKEVGKKNTSIVEDFMLVLSNWAKDS